MSEEWDILKEEVLAILSGAVEDIKGELKDEVVPFLQERARAFAKFTLLANKAQGEEAEQHRATLRHLVAQAVGEAVKEYLVKTKQAGDILSKVIGVVGNLLGKIPLKL